MKFKDKFSLSIGISAHNEEVNIRKLLVSILSQKKENFLLHKIFVICDGCTDNTYAIALETALQDDRIVVENDGKRLGKSERVNQIMERANSDLLLLLDADICFSSKNFIEESIEPFLSKEGVVITSGAQEALKPISVIGKIVLVGVELWEKTIVKEYGSGAYYCSGSSRVLRKSFYKNFKFPVVIAEDIYPYLYSKKNNLGEFVYTPNARVLYKLPSTLSDYLSQSRRYLNAVPEQSTYFDEEFLRQEFKISLLDRLGVLTQEFLSEPVWVSLYFLLAVLARIDSKFQKKSQSGIWKTVTSSK